MTKTHGAKLLQDAQRLADELDTALSIAVGLMTVDRLDQLIAGQTAPAPKARPGELKHTTHPRTTPKKKG